MRTERGGEQGSALKAGDPKEVQRRGLWHDVRSLLAAATTNVEYLSTLAGVPAEGIEISREIEHVLRLATAIIELVSSERDPAATVEIDLRALLWLTRTSGVRIVVDATLPPCIIRGPHAALLKWSEAIVAVVVPGKPAQVAQMEGALEISGLDPEGVAGIAQRDHGLSADMSVVAPGTLRIRPHR